MPLTTVARRTGVSIGAMPSGAAQPVAPGFNYIQTMCLGKNGVLYATNRGNENNFGMHVNKVQLGGPGEEELTRRLLRIRRRRRQLHLAVRHRRRRRARPGLLLGRVDEHDLGVRHQRQVLTEMGQDRQRRWSSCCARPAWRSRRTATSSSSTAATTGCRSSPRTASSSANAAGPGKAPVEFNQPWGITLDKDGNIYVADWNNHRIQKLSPRGQAPDEDRQFGKVEEPEGAYAVTTFGPYVSGESEKAGHPRTDQFNHPTDVAVDSDGDIYVMRLGQPSGLRVRLRGRADHHS